MMALLITHTAQRGRLAAVRQLRHCSPVFTSRSCSSTAAPENSRSVQGPSGRQLRAHFVQSMVPMIGFGFMDNTVMIHAGNAIDLTLGVTFGLSTLAAAACGQICSDVAGVSFGGFIDAAAARLGLPRPEFLPGQRDLAIVKRIGLMGSIIGVFIGCCLGLTNLLWIDTNESKMLKLASGSETGNDTYQVSISNQEMETATTITIEGPAAKGLIASVTACLTHADLAIQEIHSSSAEFGEWKSRKVVVNQNGEQVDNHQLEMVAKTVMAACKKPDTVRHFMLANDTLIKENKDLRLRLEQLETRLENSLIQITKKGSSSPVHPES